MTNIGMQNEMALETWLKRATCHLSAASAARVRTEIQQHCESARETALGSGATLEEADRVAVASLGDAATANRQYRKVLVTTAEARLLREARWEGRVICSQPWVRWLPLIPVAGLAASAWLFAAGQTYLPFMLLVGMAGLGLLCAARFLPINTPARGRVFRGVRWAWLVAILVLASWPHVLAPWLLTSCLWPVVWVEWTFISLRRKLPVAEWPRQLYL